ncbi:MAG: DNA mismatch repair endonuclease MutL [Firmicutes bacterium]|nr:DNA mismatch repair endonuclease MutL [Bacillota bacterium]
MTQIRILPPEVAHKIAAGEVIERPASVVKELIENSIDAQATQITVEIRGGGIEFIRVQDNGVGIPQDELELAFQPHATSKITTADDLFALYTLGFRGEALPSIASVSKLTMYSRPVTQDHGFKIWSQGGQFIVEPTGTPPGTTVEVQDLFYNVPARLKFLKTPPTERRHVLNTATNLALAHPHISFRLIAEGKTVLVTPGNGRLLDTILIVEGKNIASDLIKIQGDFAWGQIWGYLGSPRLGKGNRSGQIFILNGRVIESQSLRVALEKGYAGLLPTRTYPWALIILDLNPQLVDCNVHPAKAEVRFSNEQTIFSDLLQTVRSGLVGSNLAPSLQEPPRPVQSGKPAKPVSRTTQAQLQWEPTTWQFMDELLREYRPAKEKESVRREQIQPQASSPFQSTDFVVEENPQSLEDAPKPIEKLDEVRKELLEGRIIGQLQQTYILLEVSTGLWLLDQHIVQERILFEQLRKDWEAQTIHVQELVISQHLEFTPSEAMLVGESLEQLGEFGLELEEFGNNSFLLRAVPSYLAGTGGNWKEEILQIAETARKTTAWQEEALITLACKGSIKAGDYLDERIMRALLNDLAKTENPFTCPHGRPIIVRLETPELLRRFGRI